MNAPPLELAEVRVSFGGKPIIDAASFTLGPGDLAVLTGANGAGKSTLLRAVTHLLPFEGDVKMSGHHPASEAGRASFALVPDEPALYEDLTLREHARFTALIYGQPRAELATLEWLDAFRLLDKVDEFPVTHSRGMRQKLSLALALGLSVPLVILDEPYNGLDFEAQEGLSAALQRKAEDGQAVLLTGHQPGLATRLDATSLVLEDGRIKGDG